MMSGKASHRAPDARRCLFNVWCLLMACPSANAQVTALAHATLIDGTGRPALADATVLIEGHTIEAVGPAARVKPPAGASIVDLTGKFVIPGIINLHSHPGLVKGLVADATNYSRE